MGGQIQEPNTVSRRGFTKAIAALFLTPPAVYIGRNRDLSTKNEPIVRNAYSAANEALIAFDENVDSVASENLTRVVASLKVDLKSFGISKIEYGKISGLEACGASHLGEDRIQIDTDKNQIEELQHVLGHEVGHFVDFNRIDSTTRDQFSEIIGVTPDLNSESPWFSAPVDPPGSQLWAEYCGVLLLGSDPKTYIHNDALSEAERGFLTSHQFATGAELQTIMEWMAFATGIPRSSTILAEVQPLESLPFDFMTMQDQREYRRQQVEPWRASDASNVSGSPVMPNETNLNESPSTTRSGLSR